MKFTLEVVCAPVSDVDRSQLTERGVEVSDIQIHGRIGLRPREPDDDLNNVDFRYLADPDGNRWAIQQNSSREP